MVRTYTIVVFCVLFSSCTFSPQHETRAVLGETRLHTKVDSGIAKYYLEHYLRGDHVRQEFDRDIDKVIADIGRTVPNRAQLKALSSQYSVDFAALMLWRTLLVDARNNEVQDAYRQELAIIRASLTTSSPLKTGAGSELLIAFAPGWFYKSQPETGADFAKQRLTLNQAGVRTVLLDLEENGTVEANSKLVAQQMLALSRDHTSIILVSTSKAGPEVALALTSLHRENLPHHVKAWVNIGGVLHGSALADWALTWPVCLFVDAYVLGGGSFDGVQT